jgi:hypothetical protein
MHVVFNMLYLGTFNRPLMFSPLLKEQQVPEEVWLPPEIRTLMEGKDTQEEPATLKSQLDRILERISHVEVMLKQLGMEDRLKRIENCQAGLVSRSRGA